MGRFRLAALVAPVLALGLACASVAPAVAVNCAGTSVGSTPLTDLGTGTYQGFEGGLYPGGENEPPDSYAEVGLAKAARVLPRDAEGRPDADGTIVLLSIGLSNTTQEFSVFKELADTDERKNPLVTIVDGAVGGQDAVILSDPENRYWSVVDRRLAAARVTAGQVQVIWLKEAIMREDRPFPEDATGLKDLLAKIVDIAHARFPNARLIFLSSRTYAGYATIRLNPEPHAYQTGFAVKWLIEDRIADEMDGPWLGWGPYFWTDGTAGRADGFVWSCDDVEPDGTHPSASGERKVADLLLNFFTADPLTKGWFLAD